MTATDRLRAMLDERGIKHQDSDACTLWGHDDRGYRYMAQSMHSGRMSVHIWCDTPEQAIAATLGAGTCELHDCEGSFSAVNKPVWRCDCGAFMTQYTDATAYHKPRYCPNCGAKVVEE